MRTFVLLFLYAIIVVLSIPVLLVCGIFRWLPPIVFVGRSGVRLGKAVLGVRIEVSGCEHVDFDRTYVYMPNHLSFLDGPMMFIVLPCFVRVIAKQELFRVPFLAQAMRVAEFVPVDRKGREGGKKAIQRAVRLIREKGHSFMIFPEGTRSLDGRLQRFRRGGFYLALETGSPIVPVSIIGSYELMPKKAFFTKRGTIRVKIHPPVSVDGFDVDTMPDLIEKVRKTVAAGVRDTVNPNLPAGVRSEG
jgi:1-acyl-sn-glycerol-3-phosphate acyltransferase